MVTVGRCIRLCVLLLLNYRRFCSQDRIRTCVSSYEFVIPCISNVLPDHIGHGFGFPICAHTFSSCVILREVTRYPPKNPYFLSAQKFVKRPYYRLVYFTRPSSTFYIQEPIPSYGENERR